MPNNVGEPTVDEVYRHVVAQASPKIDQIAVSAVTLANASLGIIKTNDGVKSKKY